jgi:hypothetical protein
MQPFMESLEETARQALLAAKFGALAAEDKDSVLALAASIASRANNPAIPQAPLRSVGKNAAAAG